MPKGNRRWFLLQLSVQLFGDEVFTVEPIPRSQVYDRDNPLIPIDNLDSCTTFHRAFTVIYSGESGWGTSRVRPPAPRLVWTGVDPMPNVQLGSLVLCTSFHSFWWDKWDFRSHTPNSLWLFS